MKHTPVQLALVAVCMMLCGCNTTTFKRQEVYATIRDGREITVTNTVSVSNRRWIWFTQNYVVKMSGDVASLEAVASGPDADFVRAVTEMLVTLGIQAVPK